MKLPKISKNGRSYVVNNLYVECILNKRYPDLQLVDRQNMRGKLYKELRSYIPKEQIVYIQSAYNISEDSLLKYVEDYTIDLSNISDEIKKLVDEFCSLKNTSSRLKYLVEVSEKGLPEVNLTNFLSLIPEKFREYYTVMGPDRIKANGYQESKLKIEWNKLHQEELGVSDELVQDITDYFKLGQRYTNPDIKAKLKELYQKHGYEKTAKASDLEEYFWLKKVYISSIKKNGFEIQKKR